MLTLMLGGLGLTVTDFYLAVRRVYNDVVLLFRFIGKRRPAIIEKADAVGVEGA